MMFAYCVLSLHTKKGKVLVYYIMSHSQTNSFKIFMPLKYLLNPYIKHNTFNILLSLSSNPKTEQKKLCGENLNRFINKHFIS